MKFLFNRQVGDAKSPILLTVIMIEKDKIVTWVEETLNDNQFIVSVDVSPSNQITVLLDGEEGITIQKCVEVNRKIEDELDRDVEDFELNVSSSGLGQPFKVFRQYTKNVGKEVEVLLKDGQKLTGTLKKVEENGFELESSKREKVEGHKKKQLITRLHQIGFDETKTVKNIIKF